MAGICVTGIGTVANCAGTGDETAGSVGGTRPGGAIPIGFPPWAIVEGVETIAATAAANGHTHRYIMTDLHLCQTGQPTSISPVPEISDEYVTDADFSDKCVLNTHGGDNRREKSDSVDFFSSRRERH
jgi:hypothetical protein